MKMRRHDWADRMYSVIEAHRIAPYAYASNDCGLFSARVVDAMTGSNIAAQLAEAYSDEATAKAFIRKHGGLSGAVSVYLGQGADVRPLRGDVVLCDGGAGDAVGIWDGKQIVAMGETGLHTLPRSEVRLCWRVA